MPREIRIILGLLLTSNACLSRFYVQVHKKKTKKKHKTIMQSMVPNLFSFSCCHSRY